MKLMAFSGVFVLASAGLALAGAEPSSAAGPVKPVTASEVVVEARDALIADKKADLPDDVTLAGMDCSIDTARPGCGGAVTKN